MPLLGLWKFWVTGDWVTGASVILPGNAPLALMDDEDIVLLGGGMLPDAERCGLLGTRGVLLVLARDPLFMKLEPGKSPNLGKLNWKSLIPVGGIRLWE